MNQNTIITEQNSLFGGYFHYKWLCLLPYVLYVYTYIHLISYLSRGQGGEAVGVEELDQGAGWDLGAYPEQQGEGCIKQMQTCGLQAGGTAAQWLHWVWRV